MEVRVDAVDQDMAAVEAEERRLLAAVLPATEPADEDEEEDVVDLLGVREDRPLVLRATFSFSTS